MQVHHIRLAILLGIQYIHPPGSRVGQPHALAVESVVQQHIQPFSYLGPLVAHLSHCHSIGLFVTHQHAGLHAITAKGIVETAGSNGSAACTLAGTYGQYSHLYAVFPIHLRMRFLTDWAMKAQLPCFTLR